MLQHEDGTEHGRAFERASMTLICDVHVHVGQSRKPGAKIKHRGLRFGTWNFQGLCSDRKALEIGEVLSKNKSDSIVGEELTVL